MNFKFHPADFHTTFQPMEVILNFIRSLMLAVVPSSFQSCVYFNTRGRVTWRVVDDDNCFGLDGTDYCHVPQRQGSEIFSVRSQIVNMLNSVGQTVSVATAQLNSAFVA